MKLWLKRKKKRKIDKKILLKIYFKIQLYSTFVESCGRLVKVKINFTCKKMYFLFLLLLWRERRSRIMKYPGLRLGRILYKNNEDGTDRGVKRRPQEFNISSSRCLTCTLSSHPENPRSEWASELSSSSNLYFIQWRTNRCLSSLLPLQRIERARVRRIRSRERQDGNHYK